MLLTNQQKCIMEILSKVGCIRRDQLLALLYGKYRERVMTMRPEHLTPMLRQLSGISHAVCVEDDVIRLITKTANPLLLESIDVMLEITGGGPLQFSIPTSLPALLCFLFGDELTAYYVAALTAEREPSSRRIELGEKERALSGIRSLSSSGRLPGSPARQGTAGSPDHCTEAKGRYTPFLCE